MASNAEKAATAGCLFHNFTLAWGGSGLRGCFLGGVEKVGVNFVVSVVIAVRTVTLFEFLAQIAR